MAIFNFQILLYSLSMFFFCILFPQTNSLTFNLSNFNDPDHKGNIKTDGEAYISSQGLRVTSNEGNTNLQGQVGKATYIEPLHLWDKPTGKLTDFSTHFVFVIDSDRSPDFADGLTIFLAPDGSNFTTGGAMGLPIDPATTNPPTAGTVPLATSPFVAVEFDTYGNVDVGENGYWRDWDPFNIGRAPHVGIDVNSLISNVTTAWYCNITNGIQNEAWIRYDSSSYNLSVVFTTNDSRVEGSIHLIVDLRNYLPEWVTIGFSAATGQLFERNTVTSWEFSSSLEINETNKKSGSKKISLGAVVGLVVGSVVLVGGFVLVGFGFWRRSTRAKEEDEFEVEMSMENEFESGSGPKKFSYGQLSRATNNFEEGQKLGEGGFGGVYRGFLRELNSYIAVKRISKGSKQGIKEYATEVKIISWLRHRNLLRFPSLPREKPVDMGNKV
ncbi:hypothetical protein C3L33_21086, partial [Rhododendron williamsianum]